MANSYQYAVETIEKIGNIVNLSIIPTNIENSLQEFKPGQHVMLSIYDNHQKLVGPRPFTITNIPNKQGKLNFAIKIYHGFTKEIENLKTGEEVFVNGPMGNFFLEPENDTNIVMLAGGTGVTPFISMMSFVQSNNYENRMILFYSLKDEKDFIYQEKLIELDKHPNFKVITTITDKVSEGWTGETGRINATMIKNNLDSLNDKNFLLCGPPPFIEAMRNILINELQINPKKIKDTTHNI